MKRETLFRVSLLLNVSAVLLFLAWLYPRAYAQARLASSPCMWNEAVCQRGSFVSIGVVATDPEMAKLDVLQHVQSLGFIVGPNRSGAAKITDAGFMHVQNLHGLETLDAMDLPLLTDDALASLSKLAHLRELRLEGNRNFTDAGIAHLQNLTELRTMTFYGARVTDNGIQYLRSSPGLEELQLGESQITDKGAKEISQFRQLKTLDLQGTEITDRGVAEIATLPALQWLCLRNTSVSDQGLLALRSVKTLRDLYITRGRFENAKIALLQQSLPGLQVHLQ